MRSSRVSRGRGPLRAGLLRCGFTPPASRNHRRPQVADTPTATPASPANKPLRTCAQNSGFLDSNNARAITTLLTQKGGVAKTAGNQGHDRDRYADLAGPCLGEQAKEWAAGG